MFLTTRALVLREAKYKEADKMLTLLTEKEGKLAASARGALRRGCRFSAAAQQLCYGEFTLFENRGRWTVNEASTIEEFRGLREDLGRLALRPHEQTAAEQEGEQQIHGEVDAQQPEEQPGVEPGHNGGLEASFLLPAGCMGHKSLLFFSRPASPAPAPADPGLPSRPPDG